MTLPRYSTRQRKLLLDYLSAHPHQLLSAGEIARDLREREVSLSAVYRNLAQLEAEGFVYTVAGRGSFVAEDGDQGRRRMAELTEGMHDTILELRQLGMTEQRWLDLWREEEGK